MTEQTNASRVKDVRKAEKRAKLIEDERVEGLRHLVTSYGGRLWLWRQMEAANVFSQTFTGEALVTSFNEGRRALGLGLLADLMLHCPDTFLQMMKENNERNRTDAAIADAAAKLATGGHPVGTDDNAADDANGAEGNDPDYDPTSGEGARFN